MNKLIKIIFVLWFLMPVCALAQTVTWQKWYDYNNLNSDGRDVIQTFDGGYIFLTNNYITANFSAILIKTDYLGNIEWQKLLDRSIIGGGDLLSYSITQFKDSGFVISGDYNGDSAILIKTNKVGDVEWKKKFTKQNRQARFLDHINTVDGGIIACGDLYPPIEGYIVKTDSFGNIEWEKIYKAQVGKIIEGQDGYYYILGGGAILTKISNVGQIIWGKDFCCRTSGLFEHPTGYIFTAGGYDSMTLNKLDTSGNIIFQKSYYKGVYGFEAMCLSKDNNILLAGILDTLSQNDIAVAKVDANGNQIYIKKIISVIGGNNAFLTRSVNSTNDSGFIFTGFTDYPGFPFGENVLAVKTDSLCNTPLMVTISYNSTETIKDFKLYQNIPNPFNPITIINFEISKPGLVSLDVYDVKGIRICNLVYEHKNAGKYSSLFDGQKYDLASGFYFYRLTSDNFTITKKMLMLK